MTTFVVVPGVDKQHGVGSSATQRSTEEAQRRGRQQKIRRLRIQFNNTSKISLHCPFAQLHSNNNMVPLLLAVTTRGYIPTLCISGMCAPYWRGVTQHAALAPSNARCGLATLSSGKTTWQVHGDLHVGILGQDREVEIGLWCAYDV